METVEAKWVCAGDIVSGINNEYISDVKIGLTLAFKNAEELNKAMHGKAMILVNGVEEES